MYRVAILIITTIFLISCNDSKENVVECPTIIEPVIIDAVRINLFDTSKTPLNFCGAILTIDNPDYHETIYGSALDNCEDIYSLAGGYNLVEHDVLIEKAGYLHQEFQSILPLATECSYKTFELDVYLEVN
tara:strand:+ start:673 stop:1065 length:393 start_codon:yes stop_codon:yes gene_type:complete